MIQGNFTAKALATAPAMMRKAGGDPFAHAHVDMLRIAQPFLLPDGGLLFDSDAERFRPQQFRLPYPVIVLEYAIANKIGGSPDTPAIVVCCEVGTSAFFDALVAEGARDSGIGITLWMRDSKGVWMPAAAGLIYPDDGTADMPLVGPSAERIPVVLDACAPFPRWAGALASRMGCSQEEYQRQLGMHLSNPIETLMQMLCALECRNVRVDDVAPAPARKRAAHKNLPFVSYKVLTLDSKEREVAPACAIGTHASPRTHLRRGHIRRLPSGNVWINATVVKGSANGLVVKDYRVQ